MLTRKAKHTNQPIKYIGYGWLWAMGFQCVHNCKKIRLTKIIKPLTKVNRQHPKSYKHHEKNDGRLFVGTSASQPASTLRSIFGHEGHLSKEVAREAAQHLPDW
jgi:hypothetical protein